MQRRRTIRAAGATASPDPPPAAHAPVIEQGWFPSRARTSVASAPSFDAYRSSALMPDVGSPNVAVVHRACCAGAHMMGRRRGCGVCAAAPPTLRNRVRRAGGAIRGDRGDGPTTVGPCSLTTSSSGDQPHDAEHHRREGLDPRRGKDAGLVTERCAPTVRPAPAADAHELPFGDAEARAAGSVPARRRPAAPPELARWVAPARRASSFRWVRAHGSRAKAHLRCCVWVDQVRMLFRSIRVGKVYKRRFCPR